ncbi:MAG: GWxTD domain-containing protein, partial [Candidatus Zixiibacteriota bacterium]
GSYSYRLLAMDMTSKHEESESGILNIRAPETDRFSISGIEFAHRLENSADEDQAGNPLIKNGRLVMPNPLGICSVEDSLISVYAEIYNLDTDSAGKHRVGLRLELLDKDAEFPSILDESFWEVDGESIVFARSFEHKLKEPGKYTVNLIVTDATAGITDTSQRSIYFYDPITGSFFADSELGAEPYDTASIQTRRNMVYWLLSPRNRDLMNGLNEGGQSQFIRQFWLDNDYDKTTAVNEYRQEIIQRFNMAVERYSRSLEKRDGWNTDPGRILIQYGVPDEMTEVVTPSIGNDITDEHGWQRWDYQRIQGGIYFIFANERGYSEFRLRHSNAQGETFDAGIEGKINELFRATGG